MKLTRHNGRFGRNGVYNPKHNDRRFNVENSEHIDSERTKKNVYWDRYQGYHFAETREQADQIVRTFEEIESLYYWDHYEDSCKAQNERNRKTGHTERNRSPDDLRLDKRTCPEETVLQIGRKEDHVSQEVLHSIAEDFFEDFEERFGKHIHILDWSLHMDEGTPHIHERHVFDCPNRYGEIYPQQEKALEALGIEMPYPDKKKGKTNNRKVTFDSICRAMLFEITKKYGLDLDEEPEYGGRAYLEKQDYIIMKQKESISENKGELEAVEKKLQDVKFDLTENEIRLRRRNKWLAEVTEEFDEVNSKVLAEKDELKKAEAQVRSAKEELKKTGDQVKSAKEELNKTGAEIISAKEELGRTGVEIRSAKEKLVKTGTEIISAKEELEKTGSKVRDAKEDLEWIRRKTQAEEERLEAVQETVQAKNRELIAITARIENTEEFIGELADTAYEKAVETVTEKVVEETHNMDFEVIERFREKVKTNLPYEHSIRKVVYDVTALLMEEFQGVTRAITNRIRTLFQEGGVSMYMKSEIMETVRKRLKFGPPMTDTEEPEESRREPQIIRRHRSR